MRKKSIEKLRLLKQLGGGGLRNYCISFRETNEATNILS